MRFSALLLAALSAGPAAALTIFGNDAQNDPDLKVPGDSPLELCPKGHEEDIITITSVDLAPNPPEAGKILTVTASGFVNETIVQDAYVILQVKYGLIRLISTKADLCEQIKNVDLECPIEKGKIAIVKDIELPKEIPPGKYTVLADVYNADDTPITCLTATVVFSRKSSSGFNIEL